MKKYAFLLGALLALAGCSKQWNDLVPEKSDPQIIAFDIEGQVSSTINFDRKTVYVVVPTGTDLSELTVTKFIVTEGVTCDPAIQAGDQIDLSSDMSIVLTTYFDYYEWTLHATTQDKAGPDPADGSQLYNMSFDSWSQQGSSRVWVPYAEGATDVEKATWGSANGTTQPMGYVTVSPEETFLAVSGEGKKALKLQTQGMSLLMGMIKKLAAGSIFNGYAGSIDVLKMSAKIYWGIPFTRRPKTLQGYACYMPGTIDWSQEPYKNKEGELDNAHIFVVLADWETPFEVSPPEKLLDVENDPGIIGYGKVVFDRKMEAYEPFRLDITYRNNRAPKYIAIVAASSVLGDFFTGSSSSVLYLDEMKFTY